MPDSELPSPVDDDLCIPEVKEHSRSKHHFLVRYVYAFTTAMKEKWSGLHYIDLFAGAGISRITGTNELTWGSPLIAAQSSSPFDALHLCESGDDEYEALKARTVRLRAGYADQILHGDANSKVHAIVETIPSGTLSLAFLDPYGLHLDYDTVGILSQRRCDLIVFFPDHVDILRNWKMNYHDDPNSNLDRVFGTAGWRAIFRKSPQQRWVDQLRKLYVDQLTKLGYRYFEFERITTSKGHPIYQLIFCSKHKLGAGIWRRTAKKKPDKQDTFDFGD